MSHHKKSEMKPDKPQMPDKDAKDTGGNMHEGKVASGKTSDKK